MGMWQRIRSSTGVAPARNMRIAVGRRFVEVPLYTLLRGGQDEERPPINRFKQSVYIALQGRLAA